MYTIRKENEQLTKLGIKVNDIRQLFGRDDNDLTDEEQKKLIDKINDELEYFMVIDPMDYYDDEEALSQFGLPLRDYVEIHEFPFIVLKDRKFDNCVIGQPFVPYAGVVYSLDLVDDLVFEENIKAILDGIKNGDPEFEDYKDMDEDLIREVEEERFYGNFPYSDELQEELNCDIFQCCKEIMWANPVFLQKDPNASVSVKAPEDCESMLG